MSVHLVITNRTRGAVKTAWLTRQLRKLLSLEKLCAGSWTITIVGNKEMAKLHGETMDDPTPTDVLTFDLSETQTTKSKSRNMKRASLLDLDTVLCRDVAAANAKSHGHSLDHELLLYALHSLLHVSGYDDLTPAEHGRMHRREDELLIRLGVGALYKPAKKKPTPRSRPDRKK